MTKRIVAAHRDLTLEEGTKLNSWLADKGLYRKYINNCMNCTGEAFDPINVCIDGPYDAINFAFNWEQSPEGHDFWFLVDEEWQAQL